MFGRRDRDESRSWGSRWPNKFGSNRCHGTNHEMGSDETKKVLGDTFDWRYYDYINELLVIGLNWFVKTLTNDCGIFGFGGYSMLMT